MLFIFVAAQHDQNDLRIGLVPHGANPAADLRPIEARHFKIHEHTIVRLISESLQAPCCGFEMVST